MSKKRASGLRVLITDTWLFGEYEAFEIVSLDAAAIATHLKSQAAIEHEKRLDLIAWAKEGVTTVQVDEASMLAVGLSCWVFEHDPLLQRSEIMARIAKVKPSMKIHFPDATPTGEACMAMAQVVVRVGESSVEGQTILSLPSRCRPPPVVGLEAGPVVEPSP